MHAIVVIGNELRFMSEARPLIRHLRQAVHCTKITKLRAAYYFSCELERRLERAQRAVPPEEVLFLAYLGHGAPSGWSHALQEPDDYQTLRYSTVARLLSKHPGPLVILNDCCHAEALRPHMEKAGVRSERCLLISACGADEETIPGLTYEVLRQWRRRKVFEPFRERQTVCTIERPPRAPSPLWVHLRYRWKNFRIFLHNLSVPATHRRPHVLYLHTSQTPVEEEVREVRIGRRWGAELDRHFFVAEPS